MAVTSSVCGRASFSGGRRPSFQDESLLAGLFKGDESLLYGAKVKTGARGCGRGCYLSHVVQSSGWKGQRLRVVWRWNCNTV